MLFELAPGKEIPKELNALVAANSAWWVAPKMGDKDEPHHYYDRSLPLSAHPRGHRAAFDCDLDALALVGALHTGNRGVGSVI